MKLITEEAARAFPTRSVMPVVAVAVMVFPTNVCSCAAGRAMDAILFASLYTGSARPVIGTPSASTVIVVLSIVVGFIDLSNVNVMFMLDGAVVVVGNVAI